MVPADFVNCNFAQSGRVTKPLTTSVDVDHTDTVEITEPSGSVFFVIVGFSRRFASSSSNTSAACKLNGAKISATNHKISEKRKRRLFFIRMIVEIKIYRPQYQN